MQCPLLVDCYFLSLSCPLPLSPLTGSVTSPTFFLYDLYKSSLPFRYSIRPSALKVIIIIYYSAHCKATPSHIWWQWWDFAGQFRCKPRIIHMTTQSVSGRSFKSSMDTDTSHIAPTESNALQPTPTVSGTTHTIGETDATRTSRRHAHHDGRP